jgi:hypothetical protein
MVVQPIRHILRILGNLTRQRDESTRENPRSKGVSTKEECRLGKRKDRKRVKSGHPGYT